MFTVYGYDGMGRMMVEAQPVGTSLWRRDANGLATLTIDQAGTYTTYSYDAFGDVTQIESWTGSAPRSEEYYYDSVFHQVTESIDDDYNVTTYSYDSTGDLISETEAGRPL